MAGNKHRIVFLHEGDQASSKVYSEVKTLLGQYLSGEVKRDITYWDQFTGIGPGENVNQAINSALNECTIFVFLFGSNNYHLDEYCSGTWKGVVAHRIGYNSATVLPVVDTEGMAETTYNSWVHKTPFLQNIRPLIFNKKTQAYNYTLENRITHALCALVRTAEAKYRQAEKTAKGAAVSESAPEPIIVVPGQDDVFYALHRESLTRVVMRLFDCEFDQAEGIVSKLFHSDSSYHDVSTLTREDVRTLCHAVLYLPVAVNIAAFAELLKVWTPGLQLCSKCGHPQLTRKGVRWNTYSGNCSQVYEEIVCDGDFRSLTSVKDQ